MAARALTLSHLWLTDLFLIRCRSTSSAGLPMLPVKVQLEVLHHFVDLAEEPRFNSSENVKLERSALIQLCQVSKAWAVSLFPVPFTRGLMARTSLDCWMRLDSDCASTCPSLRLPSSGLGGDHVDQELQTALRRHPLSRATLADLSNN